jgi:hypothetical protein
MSYDAYPLCAFRAAARWLELRKPVCTISAAVSGAMTDEHE